MTESNSHDDAASNAASDEEKPTDPNSITITITITEKTARILEYLTAPKETLSDTAADILDRRCRYLDFVRQRSNLGTAAFSQIDWEQRHKFYE